MPYSKFESNGTVYWYKDDVFHREDGPAVEYPDGSAQWWEHGKRHRIDGPAIEWVNGRKEWYLNGKLHRLDGPAVEWPDGFKAWWVDGWEVDITSILGYVPSVPLSSEEQMVLRLSV